jgi:Flagellar biosynthesis protein, FliO
LEECVDTQAIQAMRIEEVYPSLSGDSAPFLGPKQTVPNSTIGKSAWRTLQKILSRLRRRCVERSMKKLRVSESVSLGEKRFVAILQVENRKYLIGGGAANVALLTQLEDAAAGTPQRSILSANAQDVSCARGVN